MTTDERGARIREVRDRLVREGPPWTRGPERDFETITLPERDCDRLRDLLIAERVRTVVEIGLAYGSSALAIGEALVTVGSAGPRHIVIDPFQREAFANVGWDLLCSAGLDPIATLLVDPSSVVLPRLVAEGVVADAAFVDGSHRYHEVFVDLYFLRKIVRPGGLVVLDDDGRRRCGPPRATTSATSAGRWSPMRSPAPRSRPSAATPRPRWCPVAGPCGCPIRRSNRRSRSSGPFEAVRVAACRDLAKVR